MELLLIVVPHEAAVARILRLAYDFEVISRGTLGIVGKLAIRFGTRRVSIVLHQLLFLLQLPFLEQVDERISLLVKSLVLEDFERHGRVALLEASPQPCTMLLRPLYIW